MFSPKINSFNCTLGPKENLASELIYCKHFICVYIYKQVCLCIYFFPAVVLRKWFNLEKTLPRNFLACQE